MANVPRADMRALDEITSWMVHVRPRPGEPPERRLEVFFAKARENPELRERLTSAIFSVLTGLRGADDLASMGILGDVSLASELMDRVEERLLPPIPDPTSLRQVLARVFHRPEDADWLLALPAPCWEQLLGMLHLEVDPATPIPSELAVAIRIVAHRIAALGLRPVLTSRVPEWADARSPFLDLSDEVLAYVRSHGNDIAGDEAGLLARCRETLARCRLSVTELRKNKHQTGTSLELTSLSFRMIGLVDRLDLLLSLTDPRQPRAAGPAASLLADLVRAEDRRHHLWPLIRQNADLLIYQIVEHAARKGRSYITGSREQYLRLVLSSLGGGFIVAFFALFKVKLGALQLPLAGQALVYSLNYALCFVLIYLCGATLATKQPAVTAHTLAAALDRTDGGQRRLSRLAGLVARAIRSQIGSLFGNLAMAFPMALILAYGLRSQTGASVTGPEKAAHLLAEVHPWDGPTFWYAAIAGVYLFGAGLVQGWVDNHLIYGRIPQRIAHHPIARLFGERGAQRIADVVAAKAGAITGNVVLGFWLGVTGTVGHILGLPLDIRHIAFGSANLAMGLEGAGWQVGIGPLIALTLGVLGIGLINMIVSFGLALLMALESRSLSLREDRALIHTVLAHLRERPLEFLLPPPTTARREAGE